LFATSSPQLSRLVSERQQRTIELEALERSRAAAQARISELEQTVKNNRKTIAGLDEERDKAHAENDGLRVGRLNLLY
jgi:septal ring factor EnvC (AmiA/AmiB activator)